MMLIGRRSLSWIELDAGFWMLVAGVVHVNFYKNKNVILKESFLISAMILNFKKIHPE